MVKRIPSGRPQEGELAAYAQAGIEYVEGEVPAAGLIEQHYPPKAETPPLSTSSRTFRMSSSRIRSRCIVPATPRTAR